MKNDKKIDKGNMCIVRQGVCQSWNDQTSAELRIKIINVYEGGMKSRKLVELLARNEAPMIPCDECGGMQAEMICEECNWEGGGWLCKSCAEKHACADGDDIFLPVPNSPRAGVCAYMG